MPAHRTRVCVLSAEEIGRWEHHQIEPNCAQHHHLSRPRALDALRQWTHEIYVGPDGRQFLKPIILHYLKTRISGGIQPVVQRLRMNQPAVITPPIGERSRGTSQSNHF